MFNSNLASSVTEWFNKAFQPSNASEDVKTDEQIGDNKEEEKCEQHKNAVEEKAAMSVSGEIGSEEKAIEPEEVPASEKESNKESASALHVNTEQVQKKLAEETQKVMESAKSFGNYLYGVASEATKKVSSTVNETATTLKKTVEEKTILGDLNREQKEFILKKRQKEGVGAVPPWEGYHEEDAMKKQILALSNDSRNFLRSPPSGVHFQFDFNAMYPIAMATLKEDENLTKMRFQLVPTKIKEEAFWRNYFYRVSLIKQSAQLSTLAEMQKSTTSDSPSSDTESLVIVGNTMTGSGNQSSNPKSSNKNCEESTQKSPDQSRSEVESPDLNDAPDESHAEFVSDAFDPTTLNPDDLEREMKELGMDGEVRVLEDDIQEWEDELQKELQDYEVVHDQSKDAAWEDEMAKMLSD